ncbi:protein NONRESPONDING TO OXYLIPINS 2, mitochondrial isoform X2 [Nicotiana tomentosiformis]
MQEFSYLAFVESSVVQYTTAYSTNNIFKNLTKTLLFANPNIRSVQSYCASSAMASRCRTLSRPAINLFKSTMNKQSSSSIPTSSFNLPRPFPTLSRPLPQMGCLQSLLPLHSAVSSARLTSCLGIDSKGSRSLSQGMLCSANPGV